MDTANQSYLFESRPEAVAAGRKKYRDVPAPPRRKPITDPRVVRGNTYAPGNLFVERANASVTEAAQRAEAAQRKQSEKRQREAAAREAALNADPVMLPGRMSIPIQTDAYLDELENQLFRAEQSIQTDPDLTRKIAPKFQKKKLGISIGTSILPGELFDFDMSIEPILEVLVGKCCDQGSIEVHQEQEIKLLKSTEAEYRTRAVNDEVSS